MTKKQSSCLAWGLGCGGLLLVAAVVVGVFFYRQAQNFKEGIENPEAKTKDLLNTETLPEGYYANMAFSVPFLMDMVIISTQDKSLDESKKLGQEGFMFFKFSFGGKDDQELRDYFEGRSDDVSVLRKNNINIDTQEIINRGVFNLDGQDFLYLMQRGEVNMHGGATDEGLVSLVLIDCPEDRKPRMGIWYGPDPNPDIPAKDLGLAGTVCDEDELKRFLGHFRFCR